MMLCLFLLVNNLSQYDHHTQPLTLHPGGGEWRLIYLHFLLAQVSTPQDAHVRRTVVMPTTAYNPDECNWCIHVVQHVRLVFK
jgi:hypothetical protein